MQVRNVHHIAATRIRRTAPSVAGPAPRAMCLPEDSPADQGTACERSVAHPMKRPRHKTVMVVAPDGDFSREALEGAFSYSHNHQEWLFNICSSDGECRAEFQHRPPDGVLVVEYMKAPPWLLSSWMGPLVSIEFDQPTSAVSVHVDQVQAGALGCAYFSSKGFKRVFHVGLRGNPASELQRKGFFETAQRCGLATGAMDVGCSQSSVNGLGDKLLEWRSQSSDVIGIVAASGEVALRVCQACQGAGLTIPNHVALLGIRSPGHGELLCHPRLSTIALPAKLAGQEGARLLDDLMHGRGAARRFLGVPPVQVLESASTDVLDCGDDTVAKLVSHIRAHAHEPIRVNELIAVTGMSRRSMEKHLKSVLGQTVLQVIRSHQLAHVRRLLEDSDSPLDEIVASTAFSSSSHLAREFAKGTGLSPGAYRKASRGRKTFVDKDTAFDWYSATGSSQLDSNDTPMEASRLPSSRYESTHPQTP